MHNKKFEMYHLFTIGHSNHELEDFISILRKHQINCIVDVRSVPASSHAPQFNKEAFSVYLKKHGIYYLHFGREFGARRYDCLDDNGQVDFERAVQTEAFEEGCVRLYNGLNKGMTISLMCSEADPLTCHRFAMISRYLNEHDVDVSHILKDASIIAHKALQDEMIGLYVRKKKIPEVDRLFNLYTETDQIRDAYRLKNTTDAIKYRDH